MTFKIRTLVSIATSVFFLTGCATVIEGTGQSVAVATNPPGANCTVSRQGTLLGSVESTPGSVRVDKSKNDLTVSCTKSGYQATTVSYSPSFNGTTFGNIILGGGIGAVVDASTGANYDYPTQVSLDLPEEAAPVAAATPAATTMAPVK